MRPSPSIVLLQTGAKKMSTYGSDHPIALLSVTDKTGVVEFAKGLVQLGFTILSTGGTCQLLQKEGVVVTEVSRFADSPEILDGRVKTLHPKIHGGILMDRHNPKHIQEAHQHGIRPIDLVVVNLYQFRERALAQELTLEESINFIDIGGPTMLRAAAKNYRHVAPVIDPADYPRVLEALEAGGLTLPLRQELAAKTFRTISAYDHMIASYFEKSLDSGDGMPTHLPVQLTLKETLRYGENPHQKAGFYANLSDRTDGLQNAVVLQGKEMSYNNYMDVDAAAAIVADLASMTAVAIIKHTNPCGAAALPDGSVAEVFGRALAGDPKSAFGGIVAVNRPIDRAAAEAMGQIFLECIVAPSFTEEARAVFAKKKNLRLLEASYLGHPGGNSPWVVRSVRGGFLVQSPDARVTEAGQWQVVSPMQPTEQQTRDLAFAQTIAKHVKSNAIVYAKDMQTITVGAGQMSRIDAATFAARKAEEDGKSLRGAVMASDAFFPFRDTVDMAARLGIAAIVQPGGSVKDQESIDACREHGISMVFTGIRHFKH